MNIPEDIIEIVRNVASDHGLEIGPIGMDSLFHDLGMDELDMLEIINRSEREFEIQIPDDANLSTVGDLVTTICGLIREKSSNVS